MMTAGFFPVSGPLPLGLVLVPLHVSPCSRAAGVPELGHSPELKGHAHQTTEYPASWMDAQNGFCTKI